MILNNVKYYKILLHTFHLKMCSFSMPEGKSHVCDFVLCILNIYLKYCSCMNELPHQGRWMYRMYTTCNCMKKCIEFQFLFVVLGGLTQVNRGCLWYQICSGGSGELMTRPESHKKEPFGKRAKSFPSLQNNV